MGFQWFVRSLFRSMAEARVRQEVAKVAREQIAQAARTVADEAHSSPKPCHAAVIFALSSESGGLEDLMTDLVTVRAQGFTLRLGELHSRRLVVAISGTGRKAAAHATDAVLGGHRPPWVVSAGFCGGLDPRLRRYDLVLAEQVVDLDGRELNLPTSLDVAALRLPGRPLVGRIVSVEELVRRSADKRALGQRCGALAVDLESHGVVEVCRRAGVPCLVLRVVSDTVDDELPVEVAGLARQKTAAARFGAAFASVWNRPGSLKDMVRLKENALVASDRLARFVAEAVGQLCPLPPACAP
jgi:adenosylhomocysteine nucleosidase